MLHGKFYISKEEKIMLTKRILRLLSMGWLLHWYFVKSGCQAIYMFASKKYDLIESKKKKGIKLKLTDIPLIVLLGSCLVLYPIVAYVALGVAIYYLGLSLWLLTSWLVVLILPPPLLFAARLLAHISFWLLPSIFVINLIWKITKGKPLGFEDSEVVGDVLALMFSVICLSKL
jgi:hypothetical protein